MLYQSHNLVSTTDDYTVCIAVGLCHGIPNDHTHPIYGAKIVRTATHGLSCRHACSPGRHHCRAAINDIIHRTLSASNIASPLEPLGFLDLSGGKAPQWCLGGIGMGHHLPRYSCTFLPCQINQWVWCSCCYSR